MADKLGVTQYVKQVGIPNIGLFAERSVEQTRRETSTLYRT